MLSQIWQNLLLNPVLNILVALYHVTGNLGISIILLTLLVKVVLVPLVVPAMRNMKKQRDLQPELEKIKKKYKNNKQKLAQAQMELFKQHGLNPASGCVTQIPIIVFGTAVYFVIRQLSLATDLTEINTHLYFDAIKFTAITINTKFLYFDLAAPEGFPYALALLSGVFQFFASKYTFGFTKKAEKIAKQTPDKKDDIAYNVQEQMLYMMPIMTVVISLSLPAGTVLYILATTIFSLAQTYFIYSRLDKAVGVKKDK